MGEPKSMERISEELGVSKETLALFASCYAILPDITNAYYYLSYDDFSHSLEDDGDHFFKKLSELGLIGRMDDQLANPDGIANTAYVLKPEFRAGLVDMLTMDELVGAVNKLNVYYQELLMHDADQVTHYQAALDTYYAQYIQALKYFIDRGRFSKPSEYIHEADSVFGSKAQPEFSLLNPMLKRSRTLASRFEMREE